MADINAKYKVYNGTSFDKYNFETIADQVLGLADAVQSYRLTGNTGKGLSTVADCNLAKDTGIYIYDTNTANKPDSAGFGLFEVFFYGVNIIVQRATRINGNNPIVYVRTSQDQGSTWGSWQRIASDIADSSDLIVTLQSGWTGSLYYGRLPNGLIHLRGSIAKGTITSGTVIGAIPTAYSPTNSTAIPCQIRGVSKANNAIYVGSSGSIYLTSEGSEALSSGTGLLINSVYKSR